MHLPAPPALPRQSRRDEYTLRLASSQADVIAAQSLRYNVFALEMGAVTPGPPGLDADGFDDLCDHLIVWHRTPGRPAEAVGTYRLLPPHSNDHHPRATGLYTDRQFGLMPMESILDRTVEVGRACVRPITGVDRRSRRCGGVFPPTSSWPATGTCWVVPRWTWPTVVARPPPSGIWPCASTWRRPNGAVGPAARCRSGGCPGPRA